MKIRITESQAKRIGVLKEHEGRDPFARFISVAKSLVGEINNLYSKTIALSLEEVIQSDIIAQLQNKVNQIDSYRHKLYDEAYKYINNLPENDDSSLDMQLDDASSGVSSKAMVLDDILTALKGVKDSYEEKEASRVFGDVKPIEIGN